MKKSHSVNQGRSRIFLFAHAAAFGVAMISISAVAISFAADPSDSKCKDVEISAFFRANRDVLERLRQMATKDAAVISFINSRIVESSTVTQERRTEYKRLLSQL